MTDEGGPALRVARGASYLWTQTIAKTLVQVVAFAFIARLISTTEMGLLAVLTLVVGLAQLIVALALPSAIVRFVSEELASGRRLGAAAVLYQSLKISALLSTLVSAGCFLSASYIAAALSTKPILFQLLAVDILLSAGLIQVIAAALVGAQRFREYSSVTVIHAIVRQALILGLLSVFRDFSWLVWAWVISDVVYVLMIVSLAIRTLGPPTFGFSLGRLLKFSLPLMPGNSIAFTYAWYDRVLLIPYASIAALGIYNASLTAFNVLSSIPGGVATALYPVYAEIQSTRGRTGLEQAIRVASRYVSFIAIPLALGLFATAKPALSLFVGEQYEAGSTVLQIVTIFFALTALGNAFGSTLLLLGRTMTVSTVTAVSVAASLVTALFLLPLLGISGAAVSRGVGMAVGFFLTLALTTRHIRLSFDHEAFWKSLVASLGMVIVVSLAQYAFYNRLLLPVYITLGACTYVAGLRLLRAIDTADLELANQFLGRRLQPIASLLRRILIA